MTKQHILFGNEPNNLSLNRGNAFIATYYRKCGKPNCRCVRGEKHPFIGLGYRVCKDGKLKQKVKYLKACEVDAVRDQLYQLKGERWLQRVDERVYLVGDMFPELSGSDIFRKAYVVFGRKNLSKS